MLLAHGICEVGDDVIAWRRHLHQNPELLYGVHATARFITDKLSQFGCDVIETGIGETGVVGLTKARWARGRSSGCGQIWMPCRSLNEAANPGRRGYPVVRIPAGTMVTWPCSSEPLVISVERAIFEVQWLLSFSQLRKVGLGRLPWSRTGSWKGLT